MNTQVKQYCMNGARTSRIHQDGAAPDRQRPTLATGGQTFVSRRTRGPKSNTTEYNKANTQLKIMQWNAEGVIRKKTEIEHILKKENIDICCIQETHLQKDKRFRVRGYQCFRTDREGDKRKGGVFNTNTIKYKCIHVKHQYNRHCIMYRRSSPNYRERGGKSTWRK